MVGRTDGGTEPAGLDDAVRGSSGLSPDECVEFIVQVQALQDKVRSE